jgi:hypothetical protein
VFVGAILCLIPSYFFLGEPLTNRGIVCVSVATFGTLLLLNEETVIKFSVLKKEVLLFSPSILKCKTYSNKHRIASLYLIVMLALTGLIGDITVGNVDKFFILFLPFLGEGTKQHAIRLLFIRNYQNVLKKF